MNRASEKCATPLCINMHIMGVPEEEERREQKITSQEIMARNNTPNLMKVNLHISEIQ